ncbi:tyrosine--tRNA ligase [Candidatus Uhrbacteria bacterium]|nr:tyrosine--tRNA ligase [Candidatus Uhrbacteria bacterium]
MAVSTDPKKIEELLTRGVEEVIVADHLREQLKSGKQLRIKFGIDPTSPYMHLGHTVPLRKLRQFQDLGHRAILIIGDATAMIGDPTGRKEARKKLTRTEIDQNKKTYVEQAGNILNLDKLEIRHNGEWFDPMSAREYLELTSLVSATQLLQREDFAARLSDEENPLNALELAYPMMQGYDSVMVQADVELGGHDQKLNLLMGRKIQKKFSMPEQDIMTVPLIEGTDGVRKMSKSFGNSIALQDSPKDMFAKVMSIPDELIVRYYTLLTDVALDRVREIEQTMNGGGNPRDTKAQLGWELVRMYHSSAEADQARDAFDALFRERQIPADIPEHRIDAATSVVDVLVASGLAKSKSEARRLIEGGGVKVGEDVVEDPERILKPSDEGIILQKGKRHFVRVIQ